MHDCRDQRTALAHESPLVAFTLREPYSVGLRMVRRQLTQHDLRTAVELDVTSRIKKELGAELAPCTILFVDDPALLLEALVFHPGAAFGIPQPVVVSGNDRATQVLVRSADSLAVGGYPATARNPLLELHARIVGAMDTLGTREPAPLLAG